MIKKNCRHAKAIKACFAQDETEKKVQANGLCHDGTSQLHQIKKMSEEEEEEEDSDDGDRMAERALKLRTVQAMSQAFLQLVIQIYLFVMLALMGGATMIAGVDAATFFNKICEHLSTQTITAHVPETKFNHRIFSISTALICN